MAGSRRGCALPRRAIQVTMGVALVIAGTVFTAINLGALPGRRHLHEPGRVEIRSCRRHQFHSRSSDERGHRAVCTLHDHFGPARHASARRLPHHDGRCALLQPVASLRFFQTGRFAWGPSLGLAFGGIIGVLIAAYIVKSLPLIWLRWLVIVVIAYAAFAMLRSAARSETWRDGQSRQSRSQPE